MALATPALAGLTAPAKRLARGSGSYAPFLHYPRRDQLYRVVQPAGQQAGDDCADYRRYPEQPELTDILTAGKQCRSGAARGVDRGVGDRDRDQMDQGQGETDRNS